MGILPYIICGPTASSALHFLPSLVMKQEKLFFLRKKVVVCACSKDESTLKIDAQIIQTNNIDIIYLEMRREYQCILLRLTCSKAEI